MKKLLALLAALVMLMSTSAALADATYDLLLQVSFDQNILMARYDVEMYVNGEFVTLIEHGDQFIQSFSVPKGLCELQFRKKGSSSVCGTMYLGVNKDTLASFELHANLRDIEFRDFQTTADESAYCFEAGEEANFGGYCVSVSDYRMVSSYNNSVPAEGKVFLVCQLDITNRTGADLTVPAVLSTLNIDACCDDYELDCNWYAMYGLGDEFHFNEQTVFQVMESMTKGTEVIRPGRRLGIELVYEVNPNWKVLEVFYTHDDLAIDTHEVVLRMPRTHK